MSRILTRNIVLLCLLPLTLLPTAKANAESLTFSYTFVGNRFSVQTYAPGTRLFGQIDGTIQGNIVFINSFGTVSLSIIGFPLHTYPSIENNEFNSHIRGGPAFMSFDGTDIAFRACPSGFTEKNPTTEPSFNTCPFATEGGFLVNTVHPAVAGIATASDGSGATICADSGPAHGCRVTDAPLVGVWSLVVLPDGIDPTVVIDPSVSIGSNTSVKQGVVLEENVVLANNVTVNQNTSIGANTMIENNVTLNKDGDVGSSVMIGNNVTIAPKVVIEGDVIIGDFTTIKRGVYICSGITIGALVTIGKNNLVNEPVNLSGELPGTNTLPNPDDCS